MGRSRRASGDPEVSGSARCGIAHYDPDQGPPRTGGRMEASGKQAGMARTNLPAWRVVEIMRCRMDPATVHVGVTTGSASRNCLRTDANRALTRRPASPTRSAAPTPKRFF